MNQIVIADASPLIVLQNIGQMSLLQNLFDEISITPEIKTEFSLDLPDWIKVAEVRDKKKIYENPAQIFENLFFGICACSFDKCSGI
jgi:predicted nucleic acid-binding protein